MLDPTLNPGPDYRLVICVIVKQVHEAKWVLSVAGQHCRRRRPRALGRDAIEGAEALLHGWARSW